MPTRLKAGTENAPGVIVFDFDTSTITSNTTDLGTTPNLEASGLCVAVQCYNCSEIQCNDVQCSDKQCNQVKCSNKQCNQVKCNQVRCSNVQCNQVQCNQVEIRCSQCSGTHTDDCRD